MNKIVHRSILQLMNDLHVSNKCYAMNQQCLQSVNKLNAINESLVNSDNYQTISIVIWFPSFITTFD